MTVINKNHIVLTSLLLLFLCHSCASIKCFQCNSANNSACFDMYVKKMHAILPVVDCAKSHPGDNGKEFFCRKITQTILDPPELRVTRGCGWVKHRRECYSADNLDHLETVCQCFGDLCNAAAKTRDVTPASVAAILVSLGLLRGVCF